MEQSSTGAEISVVGEITRFEKLRAIRWGLAYDIANTFFIQLTFFGSAFVLFLNDLDLNKGEIGLLLSIFPFFGLLSLVLNQQAARFGYKRTFLLSFGLRTFFAAGLLFVPALAGRLGVDAVWLFIIAITVGFAISRASAMTALLPWQQEYIPNDIRGRYSASSSMLVSVSGLVAVAVAGYLLNLPRGLERYSWLFGVGIVAGVAALFLAARIPGGAPIKQTQSFLRSQLELLEPLRDRRFLRYLVGLGLITLSTSPVFSFLPLYMEEKIGLSAGNVVFLQTGGMVGALLSNFFWGWLADRYGSKPIALTGLIMTASLPLWWYLIPRGSSLSMPVALTIALFQGIAGSGWGIGSGRLLFVSLVQNEKKGLYLSQYSAWMGLIGGISAILGGQLLDVYENLQTVFLGLPVDSFTILFAIAIVLPLIASLILASIKTDHEIGISQFASLFFHGNPLLAVHSLVRNYVPREEAEAVIVTEQLGKSHSPLTVNELTEALSDPRFNVRFEALISIARHSSDEQLVSALVEVLNGEDPALSTIAAWALGRVGGIQALPSMRKALETTRFRSVRAHLARSLGSLEDKQIVPLLKQYIHEETDMGVKVAFASALGKLKAFTAAPAMLEILYREHYSTSQNELGLAVARLLWMEKQYIKAHRDLQEELGTNLAQWINGLTPSLRRRFPDLAELTGQLENCVKFFARSEMQNGLQCLLAGAKEFPSGEYLPHVQEIFDEVVLRMREFGLKRLEYVILLLLLLEDGPNLVEFEQD